MVYIMLGIMFLTASAVGSFVSATWWKRTALAQAEVIKEQEEVIEELYQTVLGKGVAKVYETRTK